MFVHERSRQILSAYHDGELEPALSSSVEQHLSDCTSCREEYRHLAITANAIRHLPRQEAPRSLGRLIRRRIDEEVHGMVPVLRGEILSARSRPILFPALSLGALLTMLMVAMVFMLDLYMNPKSKTFEAAWGLDSLPPVLLQQDMTSPRFRDGSVNLLPYTEVERGSEATFMALASIDQNGIVRGLEVIESSGDAELAARTLEVVRASGFEPALVGNHRVAVNFLYLFTTTEVRGSGKRVT